MENILYIWYKSKYPNTPWGLRDLLKFFIVSPCAEYSDHTTIHDNLLIGTPREFL